MGEGKVEIGKQLAKGSERWISTTLELESLKEAKATGNSQQIPSNAVSRILVR